MKEESTNFEDEDMAMITHKFTKFFKKTKGSARKKNFSKAKNTDQEQFSECFKCGKLDHIVKNYPQLKEEQEVELPRKQGRKQSENSSDRRFTKAMLAAWGDSTEEEYKTEEEEAAVALMARSDTESDDEPIDRLEQLKNKVCGISKAKLKEFLFTVMDGCDALNSENNMLTDECGKLKRDIKGLEQENKILKNEKIDLDINNLVLHGDLERIKETLTLKEESFVIDFAKLKKESLELNQKVESLLVENNRLHDKLKQVEADLVAHRRWN